MFAESPDNRHNSAWLRPFYMKTLRLERGLNETATIRKEDTFTARRRDVVTHACFRGRGGPLRSWASSSKCRRAWWWYDDDDEDEEDYEDDDVRAQNTGPKTPRVGPKKHKGKIQEATLAKNTNNGPNTATAKRK